MVSVQTRVAEAVGLSPNQLLSCLLSSVLARMNIFVDFGSHINLALIQIALYVLCMGLSGELSFVLNLGNIHNLRNN